MRRKLWVPAIVLAVVGITTLSQRADAEPIHHLGWDPVDKVYVCVGSAVDCNFGAT